LGNRLTRCPTHARNGQAISLAVLPGEVRAMMVGSEPVPDYSLWAFSRRNQR
jgi:uncharacterized Zn finger protein